MTNNNTANEVFTNETIAALIAERDALKSELAEMIALNRQFIVDVTNIEKLVEYYKRRIEFRDNDLISQSIGIQALEWAINEIDPTGKMMGIYQDKAEHFPPELFEAY